jgi:hypothetical protein
MPRAKKAPTSDLFSSYNTRAISEHGLWVSVLDRAVMDYTMFFDYIVTRLTEKYVSTTVKRNIHNSMMRELECLRWFFFEKETLPYNLAWIAEFCFEGDTDLLTKIRTRIKEKHYSNLMQYSYLPEFEKIIEAYEKNGLTARIIPVEPHKKFRLRVDILH